MACVDHLQRACVRRVVITEEETVVHREAIAPEVELAMGSRSWCGGVGGGVWDGTRGSIITTERGTCTAEMRAWLLLVTARPGGISEYVRCGVANVALIDSLSGPLQDVVDLIARIGLVRVLNRET